MLSAIRREGTCSAGHLAALFDSAQPTISKHLKVLEEAELIARSVQGRHHIFTLRPDRMSQAQAWLEHHLQFWQESLDQLDSLLDELQQPKGPRR
jgi:DNA-binding transcriptional ArsR family regulator